MRISPLTTIKNLISDRYPDAQAVFWGGSVSKEYGNQASDLDLVIIFESVSTAYREAFIYDGWPVDAFVHDLETIRYFCCNLETVDGKPALIKMIIEGHEILGPNEFSKEAKAIASRAFQRGPYGWNRDQIDKERFLITDILDDIRHPNSMDEQMISVIHLTEPLIQFYFRAQRKWSASGKSLIRLLKSDNPELAKEWSNSIERFFRSRDTAVIENFVKKILELYGGLLWDGFRSHAPKYFKKIK